LVCSVAPCWGALSSHQHHDQSARNPAVGGQGPRARETSSAARVSSAEGVVLAIPGGVKRRPHRPPVPCRPHRRPHRHPHRNGRRSVGVRAAPQPSNVKRRQGRTAGDDCEAKFPSERKISALPRRAAFHAGYVVCQIGHALQDIVIIRKHDGMSEPHHHSRSAGSWSMAIAEQPSKPNADKVGACTLLAFWRSSAVNRRR